MFLLCDIESMLAADAQCRGLVFQVDENLQNDVWVGDTVRLRQVILNLLSNAFKFTPRRGTVRLTVTELPSTKSESTLKIRVTDTGIGILPEDQERIFRSFEQVGSDAAKSQGTGLGLAISQNIVQLMGGEIVLKSEFGKGSDFSFSITLPKGSYQNLRRRPRKKPACMGLPFSWRRITI